MKKILLISLVAVYLLSLLTAPKSVVFAQAPTKTATMSMSHTGGNTVPLDSTREFTVNVNVNTGGSQSSGFDTTITYNATQITYKTGSLTFTSFYNGVSAGPSLTGSGSTSKIFFGKQGSATSSSSATAVASLVFTVASGVTSTTLMCDSYYSGSTLTSQTADNVSVYDNTGSYDLLSAQPANITFTFTAVQVAPDITLINPSSGTTAGGTPVVVTGTNFGTAGTVTFGGTTVTPTGRTDTSMTVTSPAHAAGVVYIVVTNSTTGLSSGSSDAQAAFTYTATATAPDITLINPSSGTTAGGTPVVVTGTNFGTAGTVTFGGTTVTPTGRTDTSMTVTSPAHAAGVVYIVVTNSTTGLSSGSSDSHAAYTYVTPSTTPTITNVDPNHGPAAGGTTIVITGTNFGATKGTSEVRFGTTVVTTTSWSDTSITATSASGTAGGAATITVATSTGVSGGYTFTYDTDSTSSTDPTITNLNPSSGRADTDVRVVITGTNFKPAGLTNGTVRFGTALANVDSWTDTQIVVWAPRLGAIRSDVSYTVTVARSDGKTATSSYTYLGSISTDGADTGTGGEDQTAGTGMPTSGWAGLITLNGLIAFVAKRKLFA